MQAFTTATEACDLERRMTPGWRALVKRAIPRTLAIQQLRESSKPTVLLTFDDGPHPDVTPAVLDRLHQHGARAIFFVVGRRARKQDLVLQRIANEGHVIGNHSHLHRDGYVLATAPQASFVSYYRDCARCQSLIERTTGTRPMLFRPPGGRLTPTTLLTPKLLGMRCVLWSREIGDWRFRHQQEAIAGAKELLRLTVARDIVLLHDDNSRVLDLLDAVLPGLRSRGFDLAAGVDLLL
jgi:peptidoglycan/xylan/chitin deacetylase (PgdA/CDA1 family)